MMEEVLAWTSSHVNFLLVPNSCFFSGTEFLCTYKYLVLNSFVIFFVNEFLCTWKTMYILNSFVCLIALIKHHFQNRKITPIHLSCLSCALCMLDRMLVGQLVSPSEGQSVYWSVFWTVYWSDS